MIDWLEGCFVLGQGQPTTNVNDKTIINSDVGGGVRGWECVSLFKFSKTDTTTKERIQLVWRSPESKGLPSLSENFQITCFGSRPSN